MPALSTSIGQIDFVERGEGDQFLLLFHASATVPIALMGLMKRLQSPGLRQVAPAGFRCAGTEVSVAGTTSFADTNLAIAEAVVANLDPEKLVLFGHSKGGVTALRLAMSLVDKGRPPAGLILFEPILYSLLDRDDPAQQAQYDWDQGVIAALTSNVAAGENEAGVRAFVEAWNDANWEDLPEPVRAFLVSDAQNLSDEAAEVAHIAIDVAALDHLSVPVLLLNGENSPPFTRHVTENLATALPNARVQFLKDVGHMGPINRSDLIAEAISGFIADL